MDTPGRKRHTLEQETTGSQLKVMEVWSFSSDDFPFEKRRDVFLLQPLIFRDGNQQVFAKRPPKKTTCCYLPKLLRVFCGKIECIQGSNFHTPTTYKRSYGALKDGLEPPKSWVVTPQKLGCNPLKVGL